MIIRNKNKTIIIQRLFAYLIVLKYIVQKQTLNPNPSEVDEILNNITLAYDPFGRRISKTVQGEKEFEEDDHHKEHGKDCDKDDDNHNTIKTTYYVYDNQDILMEYDQHGKVKAKYIHGLGIDEHLAVEKKSEIYFYHADGLGSIVALTDKKQHVVQTYEYDSFGNMKQQGNIKQPYTFTGREYDSETGLYYYRARYYDAGLGRFISKDPIGFAGGINLYVYTQNNPINYVDPWGLDYATGLYHKLKPGTEDPNYNCMAYGVGSPIWQPQDSSDPGNKNPNLIPPRFNCRNVNCNSGCKKCEHKIAIYEDESDWTKWHVYRKDQGWSCKYGQGAIGDVSNPTKDYKDVYDPRGKIRQTCWCCPN